MCPFDLLATVAGEILLERESSPASTNASNEKDRSICIEQVRKNEDKAVKIEPCYQGSIDTRVLVSELAQQAEESPLPQNDGRSGVASVMSTDCSECFVDEKLVNGENKNEMGSFASKVDLGFSGYRESGDCKLDCGAKIIIKDELQKTGKVPNGTGASISCLEDPGVWDGKHSALVSSDSSVKVHLCGDNIPLSSFPASREDVKIVSRDDDENSSGCTHPSIIRKSGRSVSRIGDRRIRKILASRYWKVSPKLKDETRSNVGKLLLYLNVVGFFTLLSFLSSAIYEVVC
jgi:hypothetical protein